jgi:hypothetical protein
MIKTKQREIEKLIAEMDGALDLLSTLDEPNNSSLQMPNLSGVALSHDIGPLFDKSRSLSERCSDLLSMHDAKKNKPIRVFHNLACSGGTLIAKCISALPNVYLLSEIHPFTNLGYYKKTAIFSPSDVIKLSRIASVPDSEHLAASIFKANVAQLYEHLLDRGGELVLREHAHSDFFSDLDIPKQGRVVELLCDDYDLRSVLVFRNPIDSFLSLSKNNWQHFDPFTFDEYCRRCIAFLNAYESASLYYYEDFVSDPSTIMQSMCADWDLAYDDLFENIFGQFVLTGDSGRGDDVKIAKRLGRKLDPEFLSRVEASEHFKRLTNQCERDFLSLRDTSTDE